MHLCHQCGDWEIDTDHLFCGGCGSFVGQLAVEIGSYPISDGDVPTLILGDPGNEDLQKLSFVLEGLAGDTVEELCRANPGEFPIEPWGLTSPELGKDYALRVMVARGQNDQSTDFAPNALATGVFIQSGRKSAVHLLGSLIECSHARDNGDGWRKLRVAVRNAGPPVAILSARLSVDRVEEGEDEPEVWESLRNGLLLPGETADIDAWFTEVEYQELVRSRETLSAKLELRTKRNGRIDSIFCPERAQLYVAAPPAVSVRLGRKLAALAGSTGRFGVRVTNEGGMPVNVTGITLSFANDAVSIPVPHAWSAPIMPGSSAHTELNPPIPEKPGRIPLSIKVDVAVMDVTETLAAEDRGECLINPADKVFNGWIGVDFGTSESGAALWQESMGNYPEMIDLERVPVITEPERQTAIDRAGRFIPTLIAEMADGSFRTGEAAAHLLRLEAMMEAGHSWPEDVERHVRIAREFKWLLNAETGDHGKRGEQLTTEYLRFIRERIENHPKIASRIGPETRVIATRPTQFGHGQSERLRNAFAKAGFGDPTARIFTGTESLVAESWAPLQLMFEESDLQEDEYARRMKPLDENIRLFPIPEISDEKRQRHSAFVLVCDVGAGSADFSVVEFAHDKGSRQVLREKASTTDFEFVGRRFRDLISDVLVYWVESQWAQEDAGSITRDELAIALGADPSSTGRARSLFQNAVHALQYAPGIMDYLEFGNDVQALFKEFIAERTHQQEHWKSRIEALVHKHYGDAADTRRRARRHFPLELQLPGGNSLFIDSGNIASLLIEVILAFMNRYAHAVSETIRSLAEDSQINEYMEERRKLSGDLPLAYLIRIIPSGRGAAFPLARALIRASAEFMQNEGATIATLSPVASKSITSWGALQLARNIENPYFAYRIDPQARPIDARVRFALRPNGSWVTEKMRPASSNSWERAVLPMWRIADEVAALEVLASLQVELGEGDAVTVEEVPLPKTAVEEPNNWWLCAIRAATGEIKLGIYEGEDLETALEQLAQDMGR